MWDTLLDTTINIYRATKGQDAGGGTTRTFPGTPTLANLAATIQPASAREQDLWSRRNIVIDSIIYTNADLDSLLSGGLQLFDQIKDAAGIVYVVKGFQPWKNAVIGDPYYKIICQRII